MAPSAQPLVLLLPADGDQFVGDPWHAIIRALGGGAFVDDKWGTLPFRARSASSQGVGDLPELLREKAAQLAALLPPGGPSDVLRWRIQQPGQRWGGGSSYPTTPTIPAFPAQIPWPEYNTPLGCSHSFLQLNHIPACLFCATPHPQCFPETSPTRAHPPLPQ